MGGVSRSAADRIPSGRVGHDPGPGCGSTTGSAGNGHRVRPRGCCGCHTRTSAHLRRSLRQPRAPAGNTTRPAGPISPRNSRFVCCAHDRSADRERDSVSAFKPRPRRGARRRQPAWRTDRDPDVVLLQSLFRGGNVSPAVRFRLARRGWMLCLGPQMVDNSSFRPLDGRIPSTPD